MVTGGAGFIGSHLCRALRDGGDRVISLDNYFTGTRTNHLPGAEYREGHTKDIERLIPEAPDFIYHLGEYSRVEKSFEDAAAVWDMNIVGTIGVLEYWRRRPATKLIYAGSSTKFGDDGIGRGQSPYAWAKASNSELVRNYAAWFGLRFAIAYFYNVYGQGELGGAFGTVVEIFRRQAAAGLPLTVVSPGDQERNFTHVSDIISGLTLVGDCCDGEEFGLGSKEAYSILAVARMFGGEIQMIPARKGNRMRSELDTANVSALGWRAKTRLPDYIASLKNM